MADEDRRFFHRAEPPQGSAEFEYIMEQISRLPTRRELAKYAFVLLFIGAVLGIAAVEMSWRYVPRCSLDPTSPLPAGLAR
jgi:hypothetical protein